MLKNNNVDLIGWKNLTQTIKEIVQGSPSEDVKMIRIHLDFRSWTFEGGNANGFAKWLDDS